VSTLSPQQQQQQNKKKKKKKKKSISEMSNRFNTPPRARSGDARSRSPRQPHHHPHHHSHTIDNGITPNNTPAHPSTTTAAHHHHQHNQATTATVAPAPTSAGPAPSGPHAKRNLDHLVGRTLVPFFLPTDDGSSLEENVSQHIPDTIQRQLDFGLQPGQQIEVRHFVDGFFQHARTHRAGGGAHLAEPLTNDTSYSSTRPSAAPTRPATSNKGDQHQQQQQQRGGGRRGRDDRSQRGGFGNDVPSVPLSTVVMPGLSPAALAASESAASSIPLSSGSSSGSSNHVEPVVESPRYSSSNATLDGDRKLLMSMPQLFPPLPGSASLGDGNVNINRTPTPSTSNDTTGSGRGARKKKDTASTTAATPGKRSVRHHSVNLASLLYCYSFDQLKSQRKQVARARKTERNK
jgi:hypothetical protein